MKAARDPGSWARLTGSRSAAELDENVEMFEHPVPASLWEDLKAEGLLAAQVPTPNGDVA